jgi:hypothetical protein
MKLPKTYDVDSANFDVSDGAYRLNIAAWQWCDERLTDGLIGYDVPRALTRHTDNSVKRYVAELLASGAWHSVLDKGYLIPNYLDHNWSRARVLEFRAEQTRKAALGGQATAAKLLTVVR